MDRSGEVILWLKHCLRYILLLSTMRFLVCLITLSNRDMFVFFSSRLSRLARPWPESCARAFLPLVLNCYVIDGYVFDLSL